MLKTTLVLSLELNNLISGSFGPPALSIISNNGCNLIDLSLIFPRKTVSLENCFQAIRIYININSIKKLLAKFFCARKYRDFNSRRVS